MSQDLINSIKTVSDTVKKHDARQTKLNLLASYYGMSIREMLEDGMMNGVCPAICMRPDCDYTTDMEPDQEHGYCEECGGNTVASAMILAGVI